MRQKDLIRQSVTDESGKPSGALSVPVGDFEYGEGGAGPGAITSAGCKAPKGISSECERFRYDAAGRLRAYRGYTLTWNAEGLLVEATKTPTGRRVRYYYDAWGERRLTVVEDRGKKPKVTRYVFGEYQERDGEKVWLTGAGSVGVEIVASQGVEVDLTLLDELVGFSEGTRISPRPLPAEYEDLARDGDGFGQTDLALARDAYAKGERVGGERLVWRYVTTDHLGSATHVTDSRGELVSTQRFLAYGKARDRRGAAPLRAYIGKDVEGDPDLGLVRMGARWYAPDLGRWVSPDPLIGQDPGLMAGSPLEASLYSYGANNPIHLKDPTGLKSTEEVAQSLNNDVEQASDNVVSAAGDVDALNGDIVQNESEHGSLVSQRSETKDAGALGQIDERLAQLERDRSQLETMREVALGNLGTAVTQLNARLADVARFSSTLQSLQVRAPDAVGRITISFMPGAVASAVALTAAAGAAVAAVGAETAAGVAVLAVKVGRIAKKVYQFVEKGHEVKIGKDWRIAPFGNRTGNRFGRWPHYHRRGAPGLSGQAPPGQGIGRHRPWQSSPHDGGWWDRF